jgi:hypothetical protein
MDLEDLLKGKHHHQKDHDHHGHGHDNHHGRYLDEHRHGHDSHHHYDGYHHGHYKLEMIRSALRSLPHKKALLAGLIIICLIVLILGIVVIWALLPFVSMLLDLVQEKGIQGILESLDAIIQRLWKGNG